MNQIDKIRRSVGMVGESDEIIELLALVSQVASTDISVLISGASGSGKEMLAKAIHKNSKRKFESSQKFENVDSVMSAGTLVIEQF